MKATKKMIFLLFALLLTGRLDATGKMPARNTIGPKEVLVCFQDFRISPIIGKSETDIGDFHFCRYAIDKRIFLGLLLPANASKTYNPNDVKAKVNLSSDAAYFIDYGGLVRVGNKMFTIDKEKFTKALKRLKNPPQTTP